MDADSGRDYGAVTDVLKTGANDVYEITGDEEAIAQGGTTIHSFDANGIHGLFQVTLSVHAQTTCSKCKGPIKKITIAGRGTYYCPHCQKRRY